MTTENPGSKSSSAADSYVGSLISLTSKSEIRYEGVLYSINTEESSIGLRNVRSFGTEGRKKDGPQVPPSDKVYEFILFRGSDIKDLQVKSAPPPVQPTPPVNNDPAIIQSHYPHMVSTSTSLPSAVSGPLFDPSSHNAHLGLPGSNFQGGLPMYKPGGNLGSWGVAPPAPNANGSGLAMPMYWQGYYGPPNALPHLNQQSLLRPPHGLPMPPMQQPLQYPNYTASVPVGPSNFPPPLLPTSINPSTLTSSSVLTSTLPSFISSTLPPFPAAPSASESLTSSLPNKAPNVVLPTATLSTSLPSVSLPTTSSPELNDTFKSVSSNPNARSDPALLYESTAQSAPSIVGTSNSIQSDTPTHSLVTPGQLSGSSAVPAVPCASSSQTAHKDVEVVPISSSSTASDKTIAVTAEAQPPILPLPVQSRTTQQPNGASFQSRQAYRPRERGRGRGTGISRPTTHFTEEFDFIAMNEKFKKDEVWGHLGKGNKSNSREQNGDGEVVDEDCSEDIYDAEFSQVEPVYNKDDFFDSLSSNSRGYDSQRGRTRFSEQMKLDTETFGEFSRYRGGRGGRGPNRGGRFRGGYYGRGRGRDMPNRGM